MKFAWHIHHNRLVELLEEPLQARIRYIKKAKPTEEIMLRLRLLKKVRGELPASFVKASARFYRIRSRQDKLITRFKRLENALVKTKCMLNKIMVEAKGADAALNKAIIEHKDKLEALHEIECPGCPWDGETILIDTKRTLILPSSSLRLPAKYSS